MGKRMDGRAERLAQANSLVQVIASCGRHFFRHGDSVGRLELDERGRVWWVDEWRGYRVYTHYTGRWRKFGNGGTMRGVVEYLRDYVMHARPIRRGVFGPWPSHFCESDLWGYGQEGMEKVRAAAEPMMAPVNHG